MIYRQGIYDGDTLKDVPKVKLKRAYTKWAAMLGRCYDSYQLECNPSYADVTVAEEWKLFSNFFFWLETWENWEMLELDKDIIGGRVYSSENCLMVTSDLNKFLSYKKKIGKLAGCNYESDRKKYKASIHFRGQKRRTLGRFDTELEAHLCWLKEKAKLLRSFFTQESPKVVIYLESMEKRMLNHIQRKEGWLH